jgi:hypothetical protein
MVDRMVSVGMRHQHVFCSGAMAVPGSASCCGDLNLDVLGGTELAQLARCFGDRDLGLVGKPGGEMQPRTYQKDSALVISTRPKSASARLTGTFWRYAAPNMMQPRTHQNFSAAVNPNCRAACTVCAILNSPSMGDFFGFAS